MELESSADTGETAGKGKDDPGLSTKNTKQAIGCLETREQFEEIQETEGAEKKRSAGHSDGDSGREETDT